MNSNIIVFQHLKIMWLQNVMKTQENINGNFNFEG